MQQILIAAVWILASQILGNMVTKSYIKMVEMKRNKNKNDR
jgi:hypothetical protein